MFCQIIEPVVGEALCRLFPVDEHVDLHAIAVKSREAMDKHGLNPHKLYKDAELKRWALFLDSKSLLGLDGVVILYLWFHLLIFYFFTENLPELAVFFPSSGRNHHQYSLRLPTEGWPGWVGLGGWLRNEKVCSMGNAKKIWI